MAATPLTAENGNDRVICAGPAQTYSVPGDCAWRANSIDARSPLSPLVAIAYSTPIAGVFAEPHNAMGLVELRLEIDRGPPVVATLGRVERQATITRVIHDVAANATRAEMLPYRNVARTERYTGRPAR
jgi:hypothetical protein